MTLTRRYHRAMTDIQPTSRLEVGGLPVDRITMEQTLHRAEALMAAPGLHQHGVINADKVVKSQQNRQLAQAIRSCDIVNADGMSIVWASRLLGQPVPERVAGIDFMDKILARAAEHQWPVFFLGATDAVVKKVVTIECARHPGLMVAGYRNGYWSRDEESHVTHEISRSGATLLLIGISSPAKELFVARNRERLHVNLVVGVGGSFDVVAGVTRRAPSSWQRLGLEWAFRLIQEPRRMWRRYLIGNAKFTVLILRDFLKARFR